MVSPRSASSASVETNNLRSQVNKTLSIFPSLRQDAMFKDFSYPLKMPEPERRLRFIDLFAGLGGFHLALEALGHQCVFASEIDDELCDLYETNFGLRPNG